MMYVSVCACACRCMHVYVVCISVSVCAHARVILILGLPHSLFCFILTSSSLPPSLPPSFPLSLSSLLISPEMLSEAVKLLKLQYLVQAIDAHKMDQAIVFCRTKLDCDNAENYLLSLGGGRCGVQRGVWSRNSCDISSNYSVMFV